ncbi:MAG TPA: SLATT domain-containing protein [Gemmatimonadaceae bacterium]|nr:SLATT domain-containing protein [Gemmatimonadaceae bacterium]
MERHSQTDDTAKSRDVLEGQIRECYGRIVYSHKTQEKCADILLARLDHLKLAQIVLAALSTAGFVGVLFGSAKIAAVIGMILSAALLALNAYMKDYDLGALAQKHRQAAANLWLIREQYLALLVDIAMKERPLENLQEQRDRLLKDLHAIYSGAPSTNFEAYQKAQKGLQQLEDMTFSDAEIDAFLPKELKRSRSA